MMRLCALLFVSSFLAALAQSAQPVTARQLIDRIKQQTAVTLPANTVDTFKAGNPDAPVKGIAVTMMATLDVLERAAQSGNNLIITHEPTFYGHLDETAQLEKQNDAVLSAKQKFITEHQLIVWRFHDGWHARKPDGILLGMTKALGWEKYQNATEPHLFILPETTVGDLASLVKQKLDIRLFRVVGDSALKITKVAFIPGAAGSAKQIQALERDDVEALLIGETPEWETVEYVADATTAGKRKALLILGHIPSEQAGMEECTTWLRSFISEVPVTFVPAKEPFWQPKP